MYDNSMRFAELAESRSRLLKELHLEGKDFVLATVHRDHNTDDPVRINAIFTALLDLHRLHDLPVVLPVHPRTRKMMDSLLHGHLQAAIEEAPYFHLVPPVGFLDMIALERNAKLVVTDSGGVQKEAYFFGKPVVVLRPETEWVELAANARPYWRMRTPHGSLRSRRCSCTTAYPIARRSLAMAMPRRRSARCCSKGTAEGRRWVNLRKPPWPTFIITSSGPVRGRDTAWRTCSVPWPVGTRWRSRRCPTCER
jgi:hypothetical protein